MKEEMMTAGTGGFSGSAAATGPNAGYDPVMKFRSKIKSKKDKKLVMPGNQLKAETDHSYQEKLYNIISERQLERINKLKEQGYDLSEEQINEFLGSVFKGIGNAFKGAMGPKPQPKPVSPAPAPAPPMPAMGGNMNMKPNMGAMKPNTGAIRSTSSGSLNVAKPPKSVPAPNSAIASPSMGGDKYSSSMIAKKMKDRSRIKNKPTSMMGEVKEATAAPQDQPVGLYQYKVTVPEMGTTIIYASSPTELMIKFRMLFNPRFIKQIKIERISPSKAGELFYVKRLKHLRNIKPD